MTTTLRILFFMQGGSHWIGGAEYTRNLILALAQSARDREPLEIDLVTSDKNGVGVPAGLAAHLHKVYVEEKVRSRSFARRACTRVIKSLRHHPHTAGLLDGFVRKAGADFAYPYLPNPGSPIRAAAWIPDFQHRAMPQYFSLREIAERDRWYGTIAEHAPLVVLSSASAQADFQAIFPDARARTEVLRFHTVPDPTWFQTDADAIRGHYHLPERFFVISNQFWKHKEHVRVFHALSLLRQRNVVPQVVCTGFLHDYRHPDFSNEILQSIHTFGVADQVHLLGLVPRAHQIQLMRRALAVVQPSLFEGWSTVVEDARALGKQIVLSDIPVHLEQAPAHSRYFTAGSEEALAEALAAVWGETGEKDAGDREAAAREAQRGCVSSFAQRFLQIARGIGAPR